MELAIIGGQYKRIERYLKECSFKDFKIEITKIETPRIYIQIDTDLTFEVISKIIKKELRKDPILSIADFEIYTMFHGKVDFVRYMSVEKKEKLKYFQ